MRSPKKSKVSKKTKKIEEKQLEKEVKKDAIEIIPQEKKKIEKDEFFDELDSSGIISAGELRQILRAENKLQQLENIPVSRSLERGVIFAPRMKDRQNSEGKVYSETKYDPKYAGENYANKTPGGYAGKESGGSSSESSKGSDNGGNASP